MQLQLSNHCDMLHCSPRVSLSSLGKKKKEPKKKKQNKNHQCHAGSKGAIPSRGLLLLGILLLSLLGTVFAGLLLLLATLVLFVLVTPVTLPLLALMLLAVVGRKGERKELSEPASALLRRRTDPSTPTPQHGHGQRALI